jgi:hypothetical protein
VIVSKTTSAELNYNTPPISTLSGSSTTLAICVFSRESVATTAFEAFFGLLFFLPELTAETFSFWTQPQAPSSLLCTRALKNPFSTFSHE